MPMDAGEGGRRMAGFRRHMLAFAVASLLLGAANMLIDPARPWFLLAVIAWGGILAVHVAYVMGIVGSCSGKS